MKLSEVSLRQSFHQLSEKHSRQISAMARITEFLELVATTELKCAQLLNQVEEFQLGPLTKVLTPGMTSFLQAMQSGCASKALQAWEYSEAIQADCVSPLKELIKRQKNELENQMRHTVEETATLLR